MNVCFLSTFRQAQHRRNWRDAVEASACILRLCLTSLCANNRKNKVAVRAKTLKILFCSVLCCTPSLVEASCTAQESGNTRRKSFPGTKKRGVKSGLLRHINVRAGLSAAGKTDRPYLWMHMWEREIEDTQVSVLTCTQGRTRWS